jgi:hypothetical protein
MLTNEQAQFLRRFENGGDFDTDEGFFRALDELKSSEELHYLVQLLNWDDWRTAKALDWVLNHPKCDAATALQIYWMNQPEDINDSVLQGAIPSWQEDAFELHKKIETLYLSGRFATREIAFDPATENYQASSPAAQAIPLELKTPVRGLDLGEFYDRYPL